MLEEFIWKALDLLDKLDELGEILTNPDLPDDLGGAQHVLEEHNQLKRRVTLAPVEQLSMEGHHILTKITGEIPGQSGQCVCVRVCVCVCSSVCVWNSCL